MASEKFNLSDNVKIVTTGISGVEALKSGNKVQLSIQPPSTISFSSAGWQTLGTLPASIQPYSTFRFLAFDNQASTYSQSAAVPMQLAPNGKLNVYVFSDKLSMQPDASVTYFTANTD